MTIPKVIIESRYSPNLHHDLRSNEGLAKAACRHAITLGYNPFASHLFYPHFLDEENPRERELGIDLGLAWGKGADEVWFCFRTSDYEYSEGMVQAFRRHKALIVREMFFERSNSGYEFKKGVIIRWQR